jgi:hypothetical protein
MESTGIAFVPSVTKVSRVEMDAQHGTLTKPTSLYQVSPVKNVILSFSVRYNVLFYDRRCWYLYHRVQPENKALYTKRLPK